MNPINSLQKTNSVDSTLVVPPSGPNTDLIFQSNIGPLNVSETQTQATYQPTTGIDPSGRMGREERLKEVTTEMNGRWVRDESLLLDFFPQDTLSPSKTSRIKQKNYDIKTKRWRGMAQSVKNEKAIASSFLKLLQAVKSHGGVGHERNVFDTQNHCINTHDDDKVKPDIFISALDPLVPSAATQESKPTSFKTCLTLLEFKRQKSRNDSKDPIQLATYSREVFMAQSNRQFVPIFLVTERFLEFFIFDRSGARRSAKFDYHRDPDRMCNILFFILTADVASFGFDHTVFWRTPLVQCIRTIESSLDGPSKEVTYIVDSLMMRSYTIIGSGTTFWRVRREGSGEEFIIKDSWRSSKIEDERELVREIEDMDGIARLSHTEIVLNSRNKTDATLSRAVHESMDRIHTRAVYKCHGKLLEHFENPMEILVAFYYAIKGHGLLLQRGILHQDIVPWNILIPSPKQTTHHGALIDLDRAVRLKTPTTLDDPTPGSWFFLPTCVLNGSTERTYLDDLESFFHVFCFIVVAHQGPRLASSRIQRTGRLGAYRFPIAIAGEDKRTLFVTKTLTYTVQTDFFKQPTAELAKNLHSFFYSKWKYNEAATLTRNASTPSDPEKDYQSVLTHIDNAINDLAILNGNPRPLRYPVGTIAHKQQNCEDGKKTRVSKKRRATSGSSGHCRSISPRKSKRTRSIQNKSCL